MKLIILDAAQAELEEAQVYYVQHATPGIAAAFVADYEHCIRRIIQFPQTGTAVSKRLRASLMRHFPYAIVYLATAETITVQAIAHQRRRPVYWAGRR